MNDWSTVFFISIITAAVIISGVGLWMTTAMPGIDRWNKRFFRGYFSVLIVAGLFGLADVFLSGNSAINTALYIGIAFLECLILSLPLLMMTVYLLHICGEDIRSNWLCRAALGLWAVFLALLAIISYSTYSTFTVADSQYYRVPLYPFMLLALVAILALDFAGMIRYRKRLTQKQFVGFSVALLPMMAGLIVQMFFDAYALLDISYVIAALVMFSFILFDQVKREMSYLREISNQRASIMVLRMRPHYIYNTLMSIYSLCNIDPQRARQVTMDFTNYLRKNFDAVASDSTIPFSAELEHTRAYLAVEQAQYEEQLVVEYDTPFTFFRLPPLTLQPLVENAVKHGMNPDDGPLHISVSTRHTDSGTEITVKDDGMGFDASGESESHTTLANIRQRLEMMSGGTMQITSGEGKGTVVTVKIPDSDSALMKKS